MKLRQIEVLHAILQTGSVTGVAKLLNVSQPSFSTVLQHTEAQLGMQPFERAGGRLKASPEAEALFPEIADIFRRVNRVSQNARSLAQGRLGRINVAGTLALANGYIVDAVSIFARTPPDVAGKPRDLLQRVQRMQDAAIEPVAVLGQFHAPMRTREENEFQILFEIDDQPAGRRDRHVQAARGIVQLARQDDLSEKLQCAQVHRSPGRKVRQSPGGTGRPDRVSLAAPPGRGQPSHGRACKIVALGMAGRLHPCGIRHQPGLGPPGDKRALAA